MTAAMSVAVAAAAAVDSNVFAETFEAPPLGQHMQ